MHKTFSDLWLCYVPCKWMQGYKMNWMIHSSHMLCSVAVWKDPQHYVCVNFKN